MAEFSLQMNQRDSTSTQRGRNPNILSHYPPVLVHEHRTGVRYDFGLNSTVSHRYAKELN